MTLVQITRGAQFVNTSSAKIAADDNELQRFVQQTIIDVRQKGDRALVEYTSRFDGVELSSLRVSASDIQSAERQIEPKTREIFTQAIKNIRRFHRKQVSKSWQTTYQDGTTLGEVVTPIDRVGIYVPGGKAFYPSTLIMNTLPAQIAGVSSIAVASPPGKNGLPHEFVIGICGMLGINEVYSLGGAQAVAALAFGTKSIPPVYKITGPGNRFVSEAKRQVFGKVGIDSIAGPSEIVVLHDDPSIPLDYLVKDLLTQAEHDEEARVMLITTQKEAAAYVQNRLEEIVPTLPRTKIISKSLQNNGRIILAENVLEGIDILNSIAPEHAEILIKDLSLVSKIRNAGAIFIGRWSTETVGDYFAGPNHTIPTNGAARYASPLSVRDFQKHSSIIHYSKERLFHEGELIAKFAELEDLPAHADAVRQRMVKEP